MESNVNSNILKYLTQLTHDRDYGFRHARFIADLFACVNHSWNECLEFHGESQVLLHKLPSYNITSKLCTWISGQILVDVTAIHRFTLSMLAQGSVFAPISLLLNINDLLVNF